ALKDKGIVDNGCSRHMTGKKAHLVDYQEFKGGSVSFEGGNGRITGKGKIKAGIQLTMLHSKELASPKQMTFGETETGKENSDPFMADSLPITILLPMLAIKLLLFMGYA
nr:putative ribonuclease H-like domain-containing protein [Tanacetum cinerariifolium]